MLVSNMQTHYEGLGGEAVVRRLVNQFYDLMDAEPGTTTYAKRTWDLSGSRQKLYIFSLAGWAARPCIRRLMATHATRTAFAVSD